MDNIWIQSMNVRNHKSIFNATVNLEKGLNIFIGKNGAGKSNFFEFINTNARASAILRKGLRVAKSKSSFQILYQVEKDEKKYQLNIESNRQLERLSDEKIEQVNAVTIKRVEQGKLVAHFTINFSERGPTDIKMRNEAMSYLDDLRNSRIVFVKFGIPPEEELTWLDKPRRFDYRQEVGVDYDDSPSLRFLSNYEMYLDLHLMKFIGQGESFDPETVKHEIADHFFKFSHKIAIINCLRNYTPISDIRLNPNINVYGSESGETFSCVIENLVLEFEVNGVWMPWSYLSDGTKRLFFLVMQIAQIEGGIILVEEPEIGVHPSQLYQTLDYLKIKAASNQVLISTHSPLVLDVLKAEELNRIVITKMTNEGTKFHKLSEFKKNKARRYIKEVGELSYFWLHSDLEEND